MRKNFVLKISFLLVLPLLFSGCTNQYITGHMINGDEYYGSFLSRDFSYCDVILHNKNNSQDCSGVIFLDTANKTEKDNNGVKWINAISSLSCSDGKRINLNFKARTLTNWHGEGIDQFNNRYEFYAIKKKDYKKLADARYKKISRKDYAEASNKYVKY